MENHFVLVHGAGLGAWSWYKLVALLKGAHHRVTALDLGASGIDPRQLEDLASIHDYVQPLMKFMESLHHERVILVGHSYGGLAISLAMESYPQKISAAIYVTAYMPSYKHPPVTLVKEYFSRASPEDFLDCEFKFDDGSGKLATSVIYGPLYLERVMFKNCPPEDVELGKMLARPFGLFGKDLSKELLLTEGRFGSVSRVFVVRGEDAVLPEDFQRWMIEKNPAKEVKRIDGAAHLPMLSKPNQLLLCLLQVAQNYK